ncbi:unnamed protein product [Discosporangium mesarthrocarpum]
MVKGFPLSFVVVAPWLAGVPVSAFIIGGGTRNQPIQGAAKGVVDALPEISSVPEALLTGIKAVASDVDGTLTNHEVKVTARTQRAIKSVMDEGIVFFPATGKTRTGMYAALGEEVGAELRARNAPGVFIQGLIVYSGAGDEVLYERLLEVDVVEDVASFCAKRGIS